MNDLLIDEALAHYKLKRFDHRGLATEAARVFDVQIEGALRHIQSRAATVPSMPSINFAFVNATHLNAYALRYKGEYLITVNSGVLVILLLLFNRILAEPGLLTHIGNPSTEIAKLPHFTNLKPDAVLMFNRAHGLIKPRDEVREYFSALLVDMAFHFLVGHEFAHIRNGHVDYMASLTGIPFLAEFSSGAASGSLFIDRQTMEIDADAVATTGLIGAILRQVADPSSCDPNLQRFFQSRDSALFNNSFAVDSLFRLFGDNPFAGTDLTTSYHPPTRLRQTMCAGMALTALQQADPSLTTEAGARLINASAVPVEEAFAIITGGQLVSPPQGVLDASSPEGVRHISGLLDHWKTHLRDKLQPFAYVKLTQ